MKLKAALVLVRKFDTQGAAAITDAEKDQVIRFLVRHRCPIPKRMMTDVTDESWLHACGYLYGNENFLYLAEHKVFMEPKRINQNAHTGVARETH